MPKWYTYWQFIHTNTQHQVVWVYECTCKYNYKIKLQTSSHYLTLHTCTVIITNRMPYPPLHPPHPNIFGTKNYMPFGTLHPPNFFIITILLTEYLFFKYTCIQSQGYKAFTSSMYWNKYTALYLITSLKVQMF